jgi:hypothetical protein
VKARTGTASITATCKDTAGNSGKAVVTIKLK